MNGCLLKENVDGGRAEPRMPHTVGPPFPGLFTGSCTHPLLPPPHTHTTTHSCLSIFFLRISNSQLSLTLPREPAFCVCGLTVFHTAVNWGLVVYSLCIISAVFLFWQGSLFTSHTSDYMRLRLDTYSLPAPVFSLFLPFFLSFLSFMRNHYCDGKQ